ncbi:unnamed protein product [Brassica napus]|uniref:(rape) hypothetical protein n=1 Tax=Brassica napus TaxID=3708 RepID=A0A816XHY6_BRANA|nr:unnamed protein product [Brassica napus]
MQDSSLSFFFFRLSSRRYGRFNGLSRKRGTTDADDEYGNGLTLQTIHQESYQQLRRFPRCCLRHLQACFTRWKEAKDKEEKKKVFTEFIAKKVKPSKLDDVTMSTGIASPPAAMAANRAGENVPQLKFIKLIPDVIFVLTVTILAIVSAKLSRRMYLK